MPGKSGTIGWVGRYAAMVLVSFSVVTASAVEPSVVAGNVSSFAIDKHGRLYAWGSDGFGELGLGRKTYADTPVKVSPAIKLAASGAGRTVLAAGTMYSIGIAVDGVLWGWGLNTSGQLGNGSLAAGLFSAEAVGRDFISVAAGGQHALAIKSDGTLWAWGSNQFGQLGANASAYSAVPIQVSSGKWLAVAAGMLHSLAVSEDGSLWAWGANGYGQVGDGTQILRKQPVKIGTGYKAIAAGYGHNVALKSDNSLWAWGYNEYAQVGDGGFLNALSPKQIGVGYMAIATGGSHSLAVKSDGTLVGWGDNEYGQLGLDPYLEEWVTTPRNIGTGYRAVAAGGGYSLGLKVDGGLWAWGDNRFGQLAVSSQMTPMSWRPVQVSGTYRTISGGLVHALAEQTDGSLWAWGMNASGSLGDGNIPMRTVPAPVGDGFLTLASGLWHVVAIKSDGSVRAWGFNSGGQLGPGVVAQIATSVTEPSQVAVGTGFRAAAAGYEHSVILHADGSLRTWGKNDYGQLGNGTNISSTAVAIKLAGDYTAIAAGLQHSVALARDGTVWAWGRNNYGQIGDVTQIDRNLPKQIVIPGQRKIKAIAAGWFHTAVLAEDGTLWAWGLNTNGQVGRPFPANTDYAAWIDPVQVSGTGYVALAAGAGFTVALKSDGSLWGWGDNSSGQLGRLTVDSCPVSGASYSCAKTPMRLIGNLGDVRGLTAGQEQIMVQRQDGTVLSWGGNHFGQLGNGTLAGALQPEIVVNSGVTGFLDLDEQTANNLPAEIKLPQFLVQAKRNGSLSAFSLSADVYGMFQTASRGVLPGTFNLYVVAIKDGVVLAQLNRNQELRSVWKPYSWPLDQFMSNVALGSSIDKVSVEVLEGVDVSNFVGAHIYVGYGTDTDEMVSAGRYRDLLEIQEPPLPALQ